MHKRSTPAFLQRLMQNVRSVRPEIRLEKFAYRRPRDFLQIALQLVLRVAPGEVRIRLRKAPLRQSVHHMRPSERLGQENRIGIAALELAQTPLPERQSFGVRIVHAKRAHASLDPKFKNRIKLAP